jgi:CDP-diacylglycerol--glycerol-3-phosphate 3-phosphatidyltransferase
VAIGPGARTARIPWPWILTGVRIVLVIPVVWLTLLDTPVASRVAFATFAVAAFTDTLDGALARKLDMVSSAGMLWDPIADKILVLASMIALVAVGRFPLWAAIVLTARELAITWLRIAKERRGQGFPASKLGKLKTALELIAVLLFILPRGTIDAAVEMTVLWAAVVAAVASGADYLARALRGER